MGEESPTSTLDQQLFIAERLPDRRLVVYPGLGHGIDAIHPEGCTQQVREFVASLTIQGGNYALLHVCCRERGQQDFSLYRGPRKAEVSRTDTTWLPPAGPSPWRSVPTAITCTAAPGKHFS